RQRRPSQQQQRPDPPRSRHDSWLLSASGGMLTRGAVFDKAKAVLTMPAPREEAHSPMAYEAKKSDKFTFGLWTLGNPGRDPFGEPVRKGFTPVEIVRELSKLGAYGVNFHDNDLVPFGSGAAERDRTVREFKNALEEDGM